MSEQVDVLIVGGGPGGYATALRAVARGLSATIVEGDQLGGTCLHRGCVPSKALLHVAKLADAVPELVGFGLASAGVGLDVASAGRFRDGVVGRLHRGLEGLVSGRGISVVRGWARLLGPGEVEVNGAQGQIRLRGRHVVMATGSVPIELPGAPVDGQRVLTSDDVLRLDRIPTTGVVVGGGAVGVEVASMWRSFGAEVHIVEALGALLPAEDPSSSGMLARAFRTRGIEVRTGISLGSAKPGDASVAVELSDGSSIRADQVLVAVGRRPRTDGLGLVELGVLEYGGTIATDPWGRTPVDGLWAVGDVVDGVDLAHAAFAEGFVVADAIAGLDPAPVDAKGVPRVTYCHPEVASVGLTEPEARDTYSDVRCTVLPLGGNARSIIEGTPGQVKLVTRGDGTLIGGHVVGPSATELVAELSLATGWGALAAELGDIVHAHPSLSESIREAALAAAGLPFHFHP
jgi:dihydrolipoamide dehydrogenase